MDRISCLYIYTNTKSVTVEKDSRYHNGIKITDLKLKSLYKEKIKKLADLSLNEIFLPVETDGKIMKLRIAEPLKEREVKKYLKEFEEYGAVNFHIHPTFNYSLNDLPHENLYFDIPKDEEVLKMVPIENEDGSGRFRLGLVTASVRTFKEDFKE